MSWLVTWMVITWSLVSCPPPPPVYDVYRGEIQQMTTTLQACYDTEEKPMEKHFRTYDEAEKFVFNGKAQCQPTITNFSYIGDCDLKNFEIIKLFDE